MISYLEKRHKSLPYRILSAFIAFTFIFSLILPPGYAQLIPQTLLNLPAPGMMVTPTSGFTPAMVTGITIHPDNPLQFDFIVNTGNSKLAGQELTKEANKLIKYFLAALTVPEKELWVNLSPYEKDRIIPQGFGDTEMGRDLLAQDYILKQLTASLMYPEKELGKKFWDKIYKQAREKYGTTEIPMDTFNKVWIVPEDAVIYEQDNSAFVVKSRLRVMLEEDYLSASHQSSIISHQNENLTTDDRRLTTQVIREIILPEIEKEVNEGETFASLRQIYNSTILAAWYKMTLKESLLGQVYVDQNKTKGIDTKDKQVNEKIYNQYLEAFKKGVYNYIKEDYDETAKEVIPRKYFSGGAYLGTGGTSTNPKGVMSRLRQKANKTLAMVLLAGSLAGGVSQFDAQAVVASGLKGLNGSSYVQVEANLQEFGPQVKEDDFKKLSEQIAAGAVLNPSTPASSPAFTQEQALGQVEDFLRGHNGSLFKNKVGFGHLHNAISVAVELLRELYGRPLSHEIYDTSFTKRDITTFPEVILTDLRDEAGREEVSTFIQVVYMRTMGTSERPNIENTTKSPRPEWLWGGNPAAIERQEKEGQRQLSRSEMLPTDGTNGKEPAWSAMGVELGEPVKGDPLFRHVRLPTGWEIVPTDHDMWSNLVDHNGQIRARIFYKAAFYDRRASVEINHGAPKGGPARPSASSPVGEIKEINDSSTPEEITVVRDLIQTAAAGQNFKGDPEAVALARTLMYEGKQMRFEDGFLASFQSRPIFKYLALSRGPSQQPEIHKEIYEVDGKSSIRFAPGIIYLEIAGGAGYRLRMQKGTGNEAFYVKRISSQEFEREKEIASSPVEMLSLEVLGKMLRMVGGRGLEEITNNKLSVGSEDLFLYTGKAGEPATTRAKEIADDLVALLPTSSKVKRSVKKQKVFFVIQNGLVYRRAIYHMLELEINRVSTQLEPFILNYMIDTVEIPVGKVVPLKSNEFIVWSGMSWQQASIAVEIAEKAGLKDARPERKNQKVYVIVHGQDRAFVENRLKEKAGLKSASSPVEARDLYRDFYDSFGAKNKTSRTITREDVSAFSLAFLSPDAQILPYESRRSNGTFGVTEVNFLEDSATRHRMAAFQQQLKTMFGDKVYLVAPDKLHFTIQGLETQWADKAAGTKKELAMHAGLETIDMERGVIKEVRERARNIVTPSFKMQVAGLNWNPQTGIFWELRPYLAGSQEDPVMQRRKMWELPQPRPPHVTAAYFTQEFNPEDMTKLRQLVAQYQNSDYFGDIAVNNVEVIAYTDFSFNAGYKVLENVPLIASPHAPYNPEGISTGQAPDGTSSSPVGKDNEQGRGVGERGQEKPVILLVDDEERWRESYKEWLSGLYEIIEASDGQEALKKIKSEEGARIGLVFSDQNMRRMNGNVLAGIIKKDFPNLPVIIATATSDEDFRTYEQGLKEGLPNVVTVLDKETMVQGMVLKAVQQALEDSGSPASSPVDIEKEIAGGKKVGDALHTVLSPTSSSAGGFLKGGYRQPGYGVEAGAVIDGSHAIGGEGNQGYYVDRTNVPDGKGGFKSGKQVFVDTVNDMKMFFARRAEFNKPIRVIIKTGIGGQHTPFQGMASVFERLDSGENRILGEYELGKDFESYLTKIVREMNIGWDQIAVIPSSKSGSTDETMIVFTQIIPVLLGHVMQTHVNENAAGNVTIDQQKFGQTFLDYLHTINFKDGKELPPGDLFKNFSLDDLVNRIHRDAGPNTLLPPEWIKQVLGKVLGNMFFETTDRSAESRLSAFIRNSGLDRILGKDAPGFGAMFDNVGGRWTGDLHMMTFLSFYDLDPQAYWQVRYEGIKQVRAGTHQGNAIGNKILSEDIKKIALVVPDEYFWFGKSIEQNFNESIWQPGFANLRAIKQSTWEKQKRYYESSAQALVLNLADWALEDTFNVVNIDPVHATSKQELAQEFGRLLTTFYGMTYTVGTRLIARALFEEGDYRGEGIDVNDLNNRATKILQANLFLRQPFVELGKNILEERLTKLQAAQQAWINGGRQGISPVDNAVNAMIDAAQGKEIRAFNPFLNVRELPELVKRAAFDARQTGKTFVPFIYLAGEEFVHLRDYLQGLGVEWVLQGSGDQHISWQQVLAQPDNYLPFIISFVPEADRMTPGLPAVGFAKGYLDNISPHMVRDYFAEASYQALVDQGGEGIFMRILDTQEMREEIEAAFETAFASSPVKIVMDSPRRLTPNERDAINADNVPFDDLWKVWEQLGAFATQLSKQITENNSSTLRNLLTVIQEDYQFVESAAERRLETDASSPVSFKGVSQKAGEKLFGMMPLTDEERSNIEVVTIETGRGVLHERQAFVVLLGGRQLKVYLRPKTVRALEDAVKAGNSIEKMIGEEFDRLDNETTDIDVVLDEVRMAGEGVDVSSSPMTGDTFRKGGIDLNPALLDLQIRRDGNGVPLPLPMQPIENMRIDGFLPIIINVTPITNLPMLLGLADTEQDADEITPAIKAREPEEISALN